MRRINTSDGRYHNADVNAGEQGTIVTAEALNALQEEIVSVITAAGFQLDPDSYGQLLAAIQAITGGGVAWGAITGKPANLAYLPIAQSDVTDLVDALTAKAALDSPPLTGAPTAPTPAGTDNSSRIATTAYVQARIAQIINNSPAALDTLKELADALGDDPNFAATVTNALAGKAPIASPALTGGVRFSSTGWNGVANDGVAYFGASDSYIFKNGANFVFHIDGAFNAALNSGGNIWTSGNFDPNAKFDKAGGNITGIVSTNLGASGTQVTWRRMGWSNSPDRWSEVINGDASYCLYSYPSVTEALHLTPSGSLTLPGSVTASGGFQGSDRRLKRDIAPRDVQRGLALDLARRFKQWVLKASGRMDVGLIAQEVEKVAPAYVIRGTDKRRMRAIDKAGIALECSFDNALSIAEINHVIAVLSRRIDQLEHAA